VEIVNPDVDGVAKRVVALGGPSRDSRQMTYFDSQACVEDYARPLCDRSAAGLVGQKQADAHLPSTRPDPAGRRMELSRPTRQSRVASLERRVEGEVVVNTEEGIDFSVDPSDTRRRRASSSRVSRE